MFKLKRLSNGVTIVAEKLPFVRSIALGIWVYNGSRHEKANENGISHFIEHMLFKGTKNRNSKQIAEEMDAIGGQLNAYTTKEYTCYYFRTLDNHINQALDILTDMFFNSIFDEKEIEKEKGVIIEEINMYEDSPEELVHDLMQKAVWEKDPLGEPILGTKDTIMSFNNKTLKTFLNKRYRPENTVIAVAGNFEYDEIINKIEEKFINWNTFQKDDYVYTIPKYQSKLVTKFKDIEQVHLCLSFPGIASDSKDIYNLITLNTIFGGGMSSRLFQKIREDRGLAYSVYSYPTNYKDTGLFTIYAGMNPSQVIEVINLIIKEIENLKSNKIPKQDLIKTKEQLKSNYIMGLESTNSRMSSLGKSQLMLNKIRTPDEIIEKLDEVTQEKIEILIEKIFDFSNISLSIVGNLDNINLKEIKDICLMN
ncbi:M16 family metallopeptidase [Defluviitalea phaphyphila]|uniref:M16 family metallopeptidase n=1 Tax=Defluviitalea phaphyphila TaxID=1473580 RepID=UPI0007318341|nr:pitrilysin family protein [Defluviitalea phaphyphila]